MEDTDFYSKLKQNQTSQHGLQVRKNVYLY